VVASVDPKLRRPTVKHQDCRKDEHYACRWAPAAPHNLAKAE
jgi:hypothetical protein